MHSSIGQKTLPPQSVLVRSLRIAPTEIPKAFAEGLQSVFAHAQQHGLAITGRPFARYPDMSDGMMTIEPGMCLASEAAPTEAGPDGVRIDALPGGQAVMTVHAGPYETLGHTHDAVQAWIREQGLTPAGAPWEVYVTDPMATPDTADWRTEVYWPVR
jgi:AraC family transcriptional regulator